VAVWLKTVLGIERMVDAIAWFIFSGALLQAFTGLVQYLGIAGWLENIVAYKLTPAVHGNVAQANLFATHITLGAAATIFLFSRDKFSWAFTFALITFFAFIVTVSGSRAVAIYTAGLTLLSAACHYKNRQSESRRLLYGATYFFVAFLSFQYLIEWINPWLAAQLADISLNADPFAYSSALEKLPATSLGLELRTSEWRKAWTMFVQSPFLGVGMGNYAWHSFELQALPEFRDILKLDLFGHAHNIFAQLLAETGLIGFAIFVFLLVGWVAQFVRGWSLQRNWLIGGTLLILFVHSNLEFPLWYSFFLGIAVLLLALGDTRTVRLTFDPNLGRIGTAISLALIGFTLIATLNSFRDISRFPDPFVEPQEQINALLTHAGNPILKPYAEIVLFAMMSPGKDAIEDKLAIATRACHRNPDRYKAYKCTTLLALSGRRQDAEELLRRAARAYPNDLPRYIAGLKSFPDAEIQELRRYALTLTTHPKTGEAQRELSS
jgi:O-antigen ligase